MNNPEWEGYPGIAHDLETMRHALADLVRRCDGPEGVRADGSNIDTLAAHAALGHFKDTEEDPRD
jgi:hypothetical protein